MAPERSEKIANKIKRQQVHIKQKARKEQEKRDTRLRRRRHEDQNPHLRAERRAKNVPKTIEDKRIWEDAGVLQSVAETRAQEAPAEDEEMQDVNGEDNAEGEDDDSMFAPSEAEEEGEPKATKAASQVSMNVTSLASHYPRLFNPSPSPKILITTSIDSTLHHEAKLLTTIFPGSIYIPRSPRGQRFKYKYSIHEISAFATRREFTHVIVLNQEMRAKVPSGIDIVALPKGPMFHFSMTNWIEGRRIPGHGNPTNHYPELILNGFRTELGILTSQMLKGLFPERPELQGRQVVTFHCQRDFVFFRRHRYVFRERTGTEHGVKSVDENGKVKEEKFRAGLQELGPRFTLKLRRVDKEIGHGSGQEWQWRGKDDKVRTRFQL
ncbi:Brix-domain-containing protein [Piedraia hortae CBS 480.64]|uniref:Brix-domain-containing protein n=1 Tax=Piedraia hortae CBS 480.64 TaxID=1314780 RepID=A0A6A7BSI9_9PEZI|nr:Brix-domain-containing protein [Piedraia hortae CBS 480.64]